MHVLGLHQPMFGAMIDCGFGGVMQGKLKMGNQSRSKAHGMLKEGQVVVMVALILFGVDVMQINEIPNRKCGSRLLPVFLIVLHQIGQFGQFFPIAVREKTPHKEVYSQKKRGEFHTTKFCN